MLAGCHYDNQFLWNTTGINRLSQRLDNGFIMELC